MTTDFNCSEPPFSLLTLAQQDALQRQLDIVYFESGAQILTQGQQVSSFYIIIKGVIEELDNTRQEVFAHYTHGDYFDIRSQFGSPCKHDYRSMEETLCYQLPTEFFLKLTRENPAFVDHFQQNLAQKYAKLEARVGDKNLSEFILTQIDDSNIQPAVVIADDTSIKHATQMMLEQKIETLLVEHEGQYGMLTGTDLLKASVMAQAANDTPVLGFAHFNLIAVAQGDFLFNAMLAMTQNHIERVVVKQGLRITGILEMPHLLSLFSTHSHVLALRIARAKDLTELQDAAITLQTLVQNLTNNGIKIEFIMKLMATMNGQVMKRLFQLIMPDAVQQHCCLIVMGSEGRGEQIIKTDQDNALIIRDGFTEPNLTQYLEAFSQGLLACGYPACPGKVMVNNPAWVNTSQQWQRQIQHWHQSQQGDDIMQLAILADAHCICGPDALLKQLKQTLLDGFNQQTVKMSQFAAIALRFATPLGLFGGLKAQEDHLDIKKGGIFTIVHGVRALSIEHALNATNTIERIQQLQKKQVIDPEMATNLIHTLQLFFWLRLEQQLGQHQGINNELSLSQLSPNERDLLRHGLHVVKKFKKLLAQHFMIRDY
ncbi:DUF294 nucleotidyltransferase-like domain-containing protein [Motilimonas pumila]|uniref:Cyclic nucleotide-binding/CBS domain-containing protein n=1 Tax=Motilimonas pumila TaxID=2303987 RepID=A0A418YF96_9GAMM|nr:DUF294 nucleotidyltransferase-like domain-containing protein [Motilimonas pumila]RJG47864.1 cyclic nucleotide-binding/CBS domain-containing protein [Motilimonas pumila]